MYGVYLYVNHKIRINNGIQKEHNNIFQANNLIHLSFIPLISITLFQVPLILSRLSDFYLIPLSLSIYCLNKIYLGKKLMIHNLLTFMGIVSYSSYAVITNLILK